MMTHAGRKTSFRERLAGCGRNPMAFLGNETGASFVFATLALPVLLGMAGLAFDSTIWYMEKRQNQSVADTASMVAAMEVYRNPDITDEDLAAAVTDNALRNGFDKKAGVRRIIVNRLAGNDVEVIVEEDRNLYLSSALLGGGSQTIRARAVGGITTFGDHCVVSLDETADRAIEVTGTAFVDLPCGIAANSNSNEAIYISGNATLDADPAQAFGDIYVKDPTKLVTNTPPQSYSERVKDPYAARFADASLSPEMIPKLSGACKSDTPVFDLKSAPGSGTAGDPYRLSPNYPTGSVKLYCGGIKVTPAQNVDLAPGVYIIDDGDFDVSGTVTCSACAEPNGVTIILTAWQPGSGSEDVGDFTINAGGTLNLMAPTTGNYAGLLYVIDPAAPPSLGSKFNGGGTSNFSGAMYMPSRDVTINGNFQASSKCLMIYAKTVKFSGGSAADPVTLDNSECDDAGVEVIQQVRVRVIQ